MPNTPDLDALERLAAEAKLPLKAHDTPDYAEIVDTSGSKVALTIEPLLILALNELPALLAAASEAEALRAEVGRLREAVDKTREAFDEVWPFYEGEHYYDHPCSVRVRALIEAADALATPTPQPAAQEDAL